MKKQIKNNNNAGQSAIDVRKSQKHEVNLQKNSTLYFQIGLILCLLGTFALFEMQFESKSYVLAELKPDDTTIDYQIKEVKEYVPEKKQEPKKKVSEKIIDKIDEVKNTHKKLEKEVITQEQNTTSKPQIFDPRDVDVPDIIENDVPVDRVQFVPIFPGCEKFELNSERKKCLNEKMGKLVRKKFDTDIASEYGLSGIQRIYVGFKVDKTGNIVDIRTRSPHPKLDEEAIRIANEIPKMEPGKMGTTPVNVIYNLPITFKVQD